MASDSEKSLKTMKHQNNDLACHATDWRPVQGVVGLPPKVSWNRLPLILFRINSVENR